MAHGIFSRVRWLIVPFSTVLLAIVTACTVCTEQIVGETTSPDHQWTTRTTVRDCGNLSTPTMNVYLQHVDSRARLGDIVMLVRHNHVLKIAWTANTQVHIDCPGCGEDVRIARPSVHGISIVVSR
jgi:cyanophycinase-like exopeptidase